MQVLYPRCCGLDIHKKTVVACVLLTDPDGTIHRFVRTFGTMTVDLLALGDWLRLHQVTHVAMESTGVLSPLLSNIYLDKFDSYVEQVLIPAYTREARRRPHLPYEALRAQAKRRKRAGKRKDDDFTIISRDQAEYRGLVQYYRLAINVCWLHKLHWVMQTSLLRTLARKHRTSLKAMSES